MEIKDKIRILRIEKGFSQEQLAEKLEVSRQSVAKWELGVSVPDIKRLIQISKIFKVSLDKLLKNDSCNEEIKQKNEEHNNSEVIEFLCKAKKNTYAGNGKQQEISSRPKSHDLIYESDKYKYIDTYLGGERFLGEEAVFENDNPIWAMNYSGIEINEKFSADFLKSSLLNVPKEKPFRGPEIYKEGDYIYICRVEGDFNWFQGKEEMFYKTEKVYECYFHGGIVK